MVETESEYSYIPEGISQKELERKEKGISIFPGRHFRTSQISVVKDERPC